MTNEQLAEIAQNPDNSELIPVLWDKVQALLYTMSADAFYANRDSFARCGVELSDIRQECYTVFLEALRAYKPEQGYKFTTYLNYPLKTALQRLRGMRNKKEVLNEAVSLDAPIGNKENDDFTLLDSLPSDIDTEKEISERITKGEECAAVHYAVSLLPEPYQKTIKEHYFENKTFSQIAESRNISTQAVARQEAYALKLLRRSSSLKHLYQAQQKHNKWVEVHKHIEWKPHYFDMIHGLKERDI